MSEQLVVHSYTGLSSYAEILQIQEQTLEERIIQKCSDTLILCEHPAVYTIGRSRGATNNILSAQEIPIHHISRGGDVTFHGPKQLVGYPILHLAKQDIHAYLRWIEGFWIEYLWQHYYIKAHRDDRNTGVWVDGKKMVAIGIALRKWVTWHGFAWNIDTDLSYFHRINPCGMSSELVTSLAEHVDDIPNMTEAMESVQKAFCNWYSAKPI
jgi:lipoyl(octanoyl) transferase